MQMGLKLVLDNLPWGVDLRACVEFLASYNKTKHFEGFQALDGSTKIIYITIDLVAKALGIKMEKWVTLSIQI